jgi:beta-lactamase superfamily II metal-dependent hydrolase
MIMMMMRTLAAGILLCLALSGAEKRKTLDLYFVDTEGGQATVIVTPAGESLLVDAGWPGNGGRDADRIVAALKREGIGKLDYLLVTHYHTDHVGGVPQFMEKFPVKMVIDHGTNTETNNSAKKLEAEYQKALEKAEKHLTVKPGDVLPLKGVKVEVVTARGERAPKPLKGGGQKNPYCGKDPKKADDPTENGRSIGILLTFGKFRFVDLGDLTWNKELEIACPEHFIGPVDVYLTTHHGMDLSGPVAIVHGLHPRVSIMNNGARKGGSPATFDTVKSSPGLLDLWQLHYSLAGKDKNGAPDMIANVEEKCEGKGITVRAEKNRTFTVENERNGFKKTYKP